MERKQFTIFHLFYAILFMWLMREYLCIAKKLYDKGERMKKALPIGVENFEDMLKSGYYYVKKCFPSIKEWYELGKR